MAPGQQVRAGQRDADWPAFAFTITRLDRRQGNGTATFHRITGQPVAAVPGRFRLEGEPSACGEGRR